jgi:hypothetical protein
MEKLDGVGGPPHGNVLFGGFLGFFSIALSTQILEIRRISCLSRSLP